MTEGVLLSLVGGVLGLRARARRRAGADSRLSDEPAAHERGHRRSARAAVHARRVDRDRPGVRPRAADAHARVGPGHGAQGRRREGRDRRGAPSHPPRAGDGRSRAGA